MANTKKFVVKNGLRAQNVDFSNSTTDKSILAVANSLELPDFTFAKSSANSAVVATT